jgi:hypothetical protein
VVEHEALSSDLVSPALKKEKKIFANNISGKGLILKIYKLNYNITT